MIVIMGHAALIDGKIYEAPVNTFVETLIKQKRDFLFIRHSIDGKMKSRVFEYKGGKLQTEKVLSGIISGPGPLRYCGEIFISYFYLRRQKNLELLLAADPLNAFVGRMLKASKRLRQLVFITCDYSEQRFANPLLNWIFNKVDRMAVGSSDQVWSVSKRIQTLRGKMGLAQEKNILVPNVPSSDFRKFYHNKRDIHMLVTLGLLGEQLDFDNIFKAISRLKGKYPKLRFTVIGNGPKEEEIKRLAKKLKIDDRIIFTGHLDHDAALEKISRSGIGLALYNGNWSFNYYGDSMKCREFFCFDLPVITTDTHSTVEDIKEYEAGVVAEMSQDAYANAIEEILEKYQEYSANSAELAAKFDDIHSRMLNKLIDHDVK